MDHKAVFNYCKNFGCCNACCLRYIGIKNLNAYENISDFVLKYQDLNQLEEIDIARQESINKKNSKDTSIDICKNIKINSVNVNNDYLLNKTEINESNKSPNSIETEAINLINDAASVEANIEDMDIKADINIAIDQNKYKNVKNKKLGSNQNGNECTKLDKEELQNQKKDIAVNVIAPPSKKRKIDICVSCLGILQEAHWLECCDMVKEVLDKKGYNSSTFACALSAPIAINLRERVINLHLANEFNGYDQRILTPLKEAWKWSFGVQLGKYINRPLDSGAVSPLLITVNYDYVDDLQELEILKKVSPQLFEERSKQKKRFVTEFTRRSVEQALEKATLDSLEAAGGALPSLSARAQCVSVVCAHDPLYLGGRYLKLSRNLPQSPWILDGKRVLPSSVQEIIYGPIGKMYKFDSEEADRRLKFIGAGREDVDVRCLGDGRPFAIEIADPTRELTAEELATVCREISQSGEVIVKQIVPITKEDLTQLKKGEETKSKTYEALCIKLSHSKYDDVPPEAPIKVTAGDISRINSFRNSPKTIQIIPEILRDSPKDPEISDTSENTQNKDVQEITDVQTMNTENCQNSSLNNGILITIQQKTPIRVLHRRPLLTRTRHILELKAIEVPDNPQLFRLSVRTSAGTYVKEWVHGELGRSRPSLCDAVGAEVDLLALDVTAVHLDWPPIQ